MGHEGGPDAPAPIRTRPTTGCAVLGRHPHPSAEGLALALSHAFLGAARWTPEDLVASGTTALGVRRRWLGPLVRNILAAYRSPPRDAPRELAAVISAAQPFTDAVLRARRQRKPIPLARYVLGTPQLRPGTDVRAEISGLDDLARLLNLTMGELDWFADNGHWNRLAPRGPLQHYRYVWRQRPGRTPRLLEVPGLRLRAVQRQMLEELVGILSVHDAAHGFVPGRSAATGAGRHTGAEVVISLDLTSFFARVTAGKVYGVLRRAGYPEAVAHSLTGLSTHAVPPWVLNAMPPGGTASERFALRQALRIPHLPQGSPSSPALANLVLYRLDQRLQGLADASDAMYTRYADDLTFSGGRQLARRADAFVRSVSRIVQDSGHRVNPRKTRVRKASVRQQVTGVVVNQKTNLGRREYEALKATVYNCVREGPESQNRSGRSDFRAHLLGRIEWAEFLNPSRGARLRRDFERIGW